MLVDELLKLVPPDTLLSEVTNVPWLEDLIKNTNKALVDCGSLFPTLEFDATGKTLRDAIDALPPATQITLLNDNVVSYGKRRRRQADKEQEEKTLEERNINKMKQSMMLYAFYTVLVLVSCFILAAIYASVKSGNAPDAGLGGSVLSTFTEVFKVIINVQ